MNDFTIEFNFKEDFGLEMDVVDNEILELSVVFKGDVNGKPIRVRSKIYEKPWESYLTPEELKEFMEMEF
jgi:hypothetical protein